MKKSATEKYRKRIQHTENAYRYGSGRTRNTNIEESNYRKLGRQHMSTRRRKESAKRNAVYNTHGTKDHTV